MDQSRGSKMATSSKRSPTFKGLDKALNRSRFNGWWSLLILPYIPFGLILTALRVCMSLQIFMMLLIVPEGKIRRFMLRISLGVLGIIVTTEGDNVNPKVFVANKLSHIDHIVLHLAAHCQTVNVEGVSSYPLSSPFNHRTLNNGDDQTIAEQIAPELRECVDYTSLAVQPEPIPTNGTRLLKFESWPFMLDCPVQSLAISVYRLWPVGITTVGSSGWWDLLWTLFVPFTYFHVRFLSCSVCGEEESTDQFTTRLQGTIAAALKIKTLNASREDVDKWLKDPPRPAAPVTRAPSMPNGPVIPISEFNQLNRSPAPVVGGANPDHASPEIEAMVQQVTAVMPQVPHTAIRQDLVSTRSVDQTITNILEGRVRFTAIPTLHEVTSGGASMSSVRRSSDSGLFGGTKSRSAHLSQQRHMSLEERKRLLLDQARRRYVEKHGL